MNESLFLITFSRSGRIAVMQNKLVNGKHETSLLGSDGVFRRVTSIPERFTAQVLTDLPDSYATFA